MLVSALAVVFAAALTFVLATPAGAQTEPCPPGVPFGRAPGTPPNVPVAVGRPAQYPLFGKCQLRLSRSVVAAGESVGVAGDGFAPGAEVKVSAAGKTLGSASANSAGSFATDVVIPASVAPGTHDVTASGAAAGGGTQVLSASLTVTGAAGSRSDRASLGDALPRTGGGDGLLPLTAAATILLGVGTAAVVAARRRRSSLA